MINIEEKKVYNDWGNTEKYPWIGEYSKSNKTLYVLFTAPRVGFRLGGDGEFGSYENRWDEVSFIRTDKVFEIKISNRGLSS